MKILRQRSTKSTKSIGGSDAEVGSVQSQQKRQSRSFKRFSHKRLSSRRRSKSKSKQQKDEAPLPVVASQSLENEDDDVSLMSMSQFSIATKANAIAKEPVKEEEEKVETKAEAKVDEESNEDAGKEAEQEGTSAQTKKARKVSPLPDIFPLDDESVEAVQSLDYLMITDDETSDEEETSLIETSIVEETSMDEEASTTKPAVEGEETSAKSDGGEVVEAEEDVAPLGEDVHQETSAESDGGEVVGAEEDVQQDTAPKMAETEAPTEGNVQEDIAPKVAEPEATPKEDAQEDIAPKVAEPEFDDNAGAFLDEVIAQADDDCSGTYSTKSRKSFKFSPKKLIKRGKRSLRGLKHFPHDEQSNLSLTADEEKIEEVSDEELDATSSKDTVQADANALEDVVADSEMEEGTSPKEEEDGEVAPTEEDGVASAVEEKEEDAASETAKENAAPANDDTTEESASLERDTFPSTNVPEEEPDLDDEASQEPSIETVERDGDVVLGYYQPTAQENDEAADEGFFGALSVMVEGLMNCGNIANVVGQPEREDSPAEEAKSPPLTSEDGDLPEGHSTKHSKSLDDNDTEQEQLEAADDSYDPVESRVEESCSENAEAMVDTATSKKQLGARLVQDGVNVHSNMQLGAGEDCRNDSNEVDPALNTEELRQEVRC